MHSFIIRVLRRKTLGKARVIIIGTDPGAERYASFALRNPHRLSIAGIASSDTKRRDFIAAKCSIPSHCRFSSWEEILERPCFADGAIVASDAGAGAAALASLECGYRLRIERPEALSGEDCTAILGQSSKNEIHVSAFNPLLVDQSVSRAAALIRGGELGTVTTVSYEDYVSLRTLSYIVREGGREADRRTAESCRGFSLMSSFMGSNPASVSSFEGESAADRLNAPNRRAERCSICPSRERCRFNAERLHVRQRISPFRAVKKETAPPEYLPAGILRNVKRGPLGRCIFDSDVKLRDVLTRISFSDSRSAQLRRLTGLDHDGCLVRIECSGGSAEIFPGAALIVRKKHSAEKIFHSDPSFALQRTLTDEDTGRFADSLAGTIPLCTPEEALRGRLIALAAERSQREKNTALLQIRSE